ncbi:glycosyltransferase family 2 protein [Glutamicibacter sp. MNS18]|uniref:glycosyltransferase family 2 protein n=1 Tax=Glutamicibacter sp. MNS18 TaxID=2989817 RepID=UPI00223553C5|nr:glycosyltransferase family A protein [Glutamicibacter sp. MNS18]MCW4464817.1 glycosyltransferase family 2 protein [Glutamicibacter sp. MNS18]
MFQAKVGSLRRRAGRLVSQLLQGRVNTLDTGPSRSAATARVAVIVPVYNAMPYLGELLESLTAQDLDAGHFEIVLVDDGSTDGSAALLDRFAREHPNVRLIWQRNSGWPGQPRNRGIAASRADYVFFADADDVMAPQALRSMVDFADLHLSDMVLPRMAGLHGRRVNQAIFDRTLVDAPLRTVFATLSPQKLIRRRLLQEHALLFPEGRVRLEDGMLISRCYLAAGRVSILAEQDYYFLRARDDGNNISARRSHPHSYTASVHTIAGIIEQGCPDRQLAGELVLDLYRRKILRSYLPARFLAMTPQRRRLTVTAHRQFVEQHLPTHLEAGLPYPFRERSERVRRGDMRGLVDLAATEVVLGQQWKLQPASGAQRGWLLAGTGEQVSAARLLVRPRGGTAEVGLELERVPPGFALSPQTVLAAPLEPRIHDLYLQPTHHGVTGTPKRIGSPTGQLAADLGHAGIYTTRNGYLSLDLRAGR